MKTPLEQIAKELAPVLGLNEPENQIIRFSRPKPATIRTRAFDAQVLASIEAALARLEHGTFGLCLECGNEISLTRLDHDPSVSNCGGCDTRQAARSR